ncbi:MAG TPA: GYF domain-containing protein [Candidatus Dormibacteraeota bacterium]|nr:GYF domain-containing protein [Candidatus Dormibacteraeota bacterium]
MYKILGGDQKQYGPVSADEVRRWIGEGRLNAQSMVWSEGAPAWQPLSAFPEFAEALTARTSPFPTGAAVPPAMLPTYTNEVLATGRRIEVGRCLSMGWQLLQENFGLLAGASVLYWLLGLTQFIPFLGIAYWFIHGVLAGGLYLVALKRIRGEPANVGEVFSGFSIAFLPLLLAGVVSYLLSFLGFCCCIIPGVYLFVAWIFSVPLIIDKRLEFWSAMELSRKAVTRVWFEVFALLLLAFLPFLIGMLVIHLVVGGTTWLNTMTVLQEVMSSSHPDMTKFREVVLTMVKQSLLTNFLIRVVLLFNLPFAVGALMYGYENLFGARRTQAA